MPVSPSGSNDAPAPRFRGATLVCALLLAGCQPSMSAPTLPDRDGPQGIDETYTDRASEWPLRFRAHNFGAHCFDTQRCEILYRGFPHGAKDEPAPSIASYGRPHASLLSAGRGPIPNFPPPAKVTWISKDGAAHQAEVDIGEIFKNELIRHNVERNEVSTKGIGPGAIPDVILEVEDRTINVYMRAHISTQNLQDPGNRYSDFKADLIKVYSRSY